MEEWFCRASDEAKRGGGEAHQLDCCRDPLTRPVEAEADNTLLTQTAKLKR